MLVLTGYQIINCVTVSNSQSSGSSTKTKSGTSKSDSKSEVKSHHSKSSSRKSFFFFFFCTKYLRAYAFGFWVFFCNKCTIWSSGRYTYAMLAYLRVNKYWNTSKTFDGEN